MAQTSSRAPTGPRTSRRGDLASRGSGRGGINRKSVGASRTDKDGDLQMGTSEKERGRGRPAGTSRAGVSKGNPSKQAPRPRPAKSGINPSTMQRAIIKGMNGGDAIVREGTRTTGRGLEEFSITGWKDSKAASNASGGIPDLISFLERKATPPDAPANEKVRIKKSRVEGDALRISVRLEDASKILRLNGFQFAGASITVTQLEPSQSGTTSDEAIQLKEKMTAMLSRRYNPELKLLDLSQLGADPEFANTGMFSTHSRQSKFFPALMTVCDGLFTSAQQKREAVMSVSLANNALPDITTVTSLSQTLPDLKNLDLSNNKFSKISVLEPWRNRFRLLDHLVLSENLLGPEAAYQDEIIKWFPALRKLNDIAVRSDEEAAKVTTTKLPLPISPASFRDEGDIAQNFIKQFFPAFDSDRGSLVNAYYDSSSSFSLSVNVSAPRATENTQNTPWDMYIKRSRNLTKITTLPARMSRLYQGPEAIREAWLSLPTSRHPDLLSESGKWCLECNSIPGLPDPSGQSSAGVGGLIIITHGEFGEVDVSNGQITATRSFDRTFILGPGAGPGGVRVVSDTLVLRAYGGAEAFQPTVISGAQIIEQPLIPAQKGQLQIPEGYGGPAPGKTEEQVQKERLVIELCNATRMTPQYSQLCLEQTGWDLENAGKAFEEVRAALPADAWF